jgi:hypothetical protein
VQVKGYHVVIGAVVTPPEEIFVALLGFLNGCILFRILAELTVGLSERQLSGFLSVIGASLIVLMPVQACTGLRHAPSLKPLSYVIVDSTSASHTCSAFASVALT